MTSGEPTRAACLTPPSPGGVAVIQVSGPRAFELVEPLLRTRRGIRLADISEHQLRLCRFMDGASVLDDVIVAVRRDLHSSSVELSLHGGPRVVQRALLRLKSAGVEIVESATLLDASLPGARSPIERELLVELLHAKTRAVTAWLMRMSRELPDEIMQAIAHLHAGNIEAGRNVLQALSDAARQSRFLLEGIRVVIAGAPNVGKSTLANALTEKDAAVVSDVPGTTRDYVEHAGAAEGIPLTVVDTAGLRETSDTLEGEAIRRTGEQLRSADVMLWVVDGASELGTNERAEIEKLLSDAPGASSRMRLAVLNKSDQGLSATMSGLLDALPRRVIKVSARTGDNLFALRARIVAMAGLTGWQECLRAPFTPRQTEICRAALEALSEPNPNVATAVRHLQRMSQ